MYKSPLFINHYLSLQAVSDGLFVKKSGQIFDRFFIFQYAENKKALGNPKAFIFTIVIKISDVNLNER